MPKLILSCNYVNDKEEIEVANREAAESAIWQRFDREINSLHSTLGFDWGTSNSVLMLDADDNTWYCAYIE